MADPPTLEEYLDLYPDTVLPCICDDPAAGIGFAHMESCPKSNHWRVDGPWRHHVNAMILGLVMYPAPTIATPPPPVPVLPKTKHHLILEDPF